LKRLPTCAVRNPLSRSNAIGPSRASLSTRPFRPREQLLYTLQGLAVDVVASSRISSWSAPERWSSLK
jgi:hypothetical protein